MAGFNWAGLGQSLSGITTALANLNVPQASITSIMNQIGSAANPNKSAELALLSQLMQFAGNPDIEARLEQTLITEQGLPADCVPLVASLVTPGLTPAQIDQTCLEIQQLINAG